VTGDLQDGPHQEYALTRKHPTQCKLAGSIANSSTLSSGMRSSTKPYHIIILSVNCGQLASASSCSSAQWLTNSLRAASVTYSAALLLLVAVLPCVSCLHHSHVTHTHTIKECRARPSDPLGMVSGLLATVQADQRQPAAVLRHLDDTDVRDLRAVCEDQGL